MAEVIVTLKIMPESPDINLEVISANIKKKIESYWGKVLKTEIIPVAFGIKSLNITLLVEEKKGDTEPLERDIAKIKGVNSVEAIDVRRAIG